MQYRKYLNIEIDDNEIISSNIVNGNTIDNMCYQTLEDNICQGKTVQHYDFIICDECHYFLTDAWNCTTDVSFRWIEAQHNATRIFMSATGKEVFKMFEICEVDTKNYYIEPDYDYMNVHYFNVDGTEMVEYLLLHEDINTENKILYFSSNKSKAKVLYERYKDIASITASEYNRKSFENTEDAFKDNKCLKILSITTSCLDNGIDIKDDTLKHIVVDIWDLTTAIQCLGRKRLINGEKSVNVYIRNWNRSIVQGLINGKRNELNNLVEYQKNIIVIGA